MKTKIYIIVLLLLFCCGCSDKNVVKEDVEHTLVIDEYKIFNYKNKRWSVSSDLNNSEEWNEFKIYKDNGYINNYYFRLNNNVSYYFDSDYNSHYVNSNFAINSKSNIEPILYDFESFSPDDYQIVSKLLDKLNYNYSSDLSLSNKISSNFDNDDETEYLYIISNHEIEADYENIFYIVFLRDNNKNHVIVNSKYDDMKLYNIAWILNATDSKYYDIIFKYVYAESYNYDLFQFVNNSYKLVIDEDRVIEYVDEDLNVEGFSYTFVIIFGIICFLGIILYLFLKKKSELVNRI